MTNQAELYANVSTGQFQCGLELIDMASPKPGDHVLDIGSGTGGLTFRLADRINPHGTLYAIEPDAQRLEVAKKNQPSNLKNISWHNGPLESFIAPSTGMFNIAFSNYVFHWIKDPVSAIIEVYNNLAQGGRFAFCCVCGMPQVIVDLCESVGEDGKKITDSLYFNTKQDWISYFERAGFTIMITNEVPDYHFQNIDDVMTWWEATTHGLFSINKLSTVRLEHIRKKYPGEINIYRKETLRLLAKK